MATVYIPSKAGHEGCQLVLIDDASASGIDQERAVVRLAELGTAEQATCQPCEWRVDRGDIGFAQQLLEGFSSLKPKVQCA